MAYTPTCGIPELSDNFAQFGTPASTAVSGNMDGTPPYFAKGRITAKFYVERYPFGIPTVARTYYEEKVIRRYVADGIINEELIGREKWTSEQRRSKLSELRNKRIILNENLGIMVPRGLEILYFQRKGVPTRDMPRWPYIGHVLGTPARELPTPVETPPVDEDIVTEYVHAVRSGKNLLDGIVTPNFDTARVVFGEQEPGIPVTEKIRQFPQCTLSEPEKASVTKRFPAEFPPFQAGTSASDRFLAIGSEPNCSASRIRAGDAVNREATLVNAVEVAVALGIPERTLNDKCQCFNCLTNGHVDVARKTRRLHENEMERIAFTRKQTWNHVVYAPNASGKTTTVVALRNLGIACFDIDDTFDWFCNAPNVGRIATFVA